MSKFPFSLFMFARAVRTRFGELSRWFMDVITRKRELPRSLPTIPFGPWGLVLALVVLLGFATALMFGANAIRTQFDGFTVAYPGPPEFSDEKYIQPLRINFEDSVAILDEVGGSPSTPPTMEPPVLGTWTWLSDRELVFEAQEDWLAAVTYRVSWPKSLLAPQVDLSRNTIEFTMPGLEAWWQEPGFSVNPELDADRRIHATLAFNYPVDTEDLASLLSLRPLGMKAANGSFQDRRYQTSISTNKFKNLVHVLSENLEIPLEDQPVELVLSGNVRSRTYKVDRGFNLSVATVVPGMRNYARVNASEAAWVLDEEYRYQSILNLGLQGRSSSQAFLRNLEIYALPLDRPASPGTEAAKNYPWSAPEEIGPEVLKASRKFKPEALPTETDYSETLSFRLPAQGGKYWYVRLKAGVPFAGGYRLMDDYVAVLEVPGLPRTARFLYDGMLLSSLGDTRVTVLAHGLEQVDFKVHRVIPDQINNLLTQGNGSLERFRFRNAGYEDEYESSAGFDESNLAKVHETSVKVAPRPFGEPAYFSLDLGSWLGTDENGRLKNGIFLVDSFDKDANRLARKLFLVSDLGLLVKQNADGSSEAFVSSIGRGQPVEGARISVLGRNGLETAYTESNSLGYGRFTALGSLGREKSPLAWVVRKGDDLTFLPWSQGSRFLDYSNFDTGGTYGADDPGVLKAFMFTDRGLYRPGEEVRLGFLVRSGDWNLSLQGTPVELRIHDPEGTLLLQKSLALSKDAFEEFVWPSSSWFPTGEYQVGLYLVHDDTTVSSIGSTQFKIEEFQPDRLAVKASFDGTLAAGWVGSKGLKTLVDVKSLFGVPSSGNTVRGQINLAPRIPRFKGWEDWEFTVNTSDFEPYRQELAEQRTGDDGLARFSLDLSMYRAPVYQLAFSARAMEKDSARGVGALASVLVSDLPWLIGVKADGNLSYIKRQAVRTLNFAGIGPDLKALRIPDIEFALYQRVWVSVLTQGENGVYNYRSVEKKKLLGSSVKVIPAGGLNVPLDTSNAGDFELVVLSQGKEILRRSYSVAGNQNIARSLERNAELGLGLDKTDYVAGEEIAVSVQAPYTGFGLITIEREKVHAFRWFKTDTLASVQRIRVPEGLKGNAYVNVSFVRGSDSKEVFMSPLSYGVKPFFIDTEELKNPVEIKLPAMTKPGEDLKISWKTRKPGKIVIYAVDEGILQVARYQSPDPLAFFLKKRALEVGTNQILDLILPNFLTSQDMAAMGGGEGLDALARNLNPFRRKGLDPVAWWSGIVESTGEEQSLVYQVPEHFNGSLRVMAVAVAEGSMDAGQASTVVRGPFVLAPNGPFFASPGDEFELTLLVSNTLAGSGKALPITVMLKADNRFSLDRTSQELKVDEGKDALAVFKVKVKDGLGAADLGFTATAKGQTVRYRHSLSIRPATTYRTVIRSGSLDKGSTELTLERSLHDEYRSVEFSASYLPLGLVTGLAAYLEQYPYGCTEQILSQAFPSLALLGVEGFGIDSVKAAFAVDKAVRVLQSRQNEDGSIGLWAASGYGDLFLASYAYHFLLEAKGAGLSVPGGLFNRLGSFLKSRVQDLPENSGDALGMAYALYVLTRNEQVLAGRLLALQEWLEQDGKGKEGPAAMFLAASYRLLKMESQARGILDRQKADTSRGFNRDEPWYTGGESKLLLAYYLHARHFPQDRRDLLQTRLDQVATLLAGSYYQSFAASMGILGLASHSKSLGSPGEGTVSLNELRKQEKKPLELGAGVLSKASITSGTERLQVLQDGSSKLYWQLTEQGFDRLESLKSEHHGIEVSREYLGAQGGSPGALKLGDELTVRLRFRSLEHDSVQDLALVDLLPSCLELDLPSLSANRDISVVSQVDAREDRVVLYLNASRNMAEFTYKVRVNSRGTFVVPAPFMESMYETGLWSRGASSTLKVQ